MVETALETGPRPKVLAAAANGVVGLIGSFGGDVDSIFGNAGIDTSDIENPLHGLDLESYCRIFEESARQTGANHFGLAFGREFVPRRLGAIGYIAISSPTLASGLRDMIHWFPAHQQRTIFALEEEGDILWLNYRITDPRIEKRQDAELSIGMFCNILRHGLGRDWNPVAVRFEHGGRGEGLCQEAFRAPVAFGCPANGIAFRRRDLVASMPASDPHLFALAEAMLRERGSMRETLEEFTAWVRHHVATRLRSGPPSPAEVAAAMGVPTQELHHRLRRSGVGFARLVRAVREESALRCLRDTDIPLTEAALELGYSELSAFSRAFRSWTGVPPREYRQKLREQAAQSILARPLSSGGGAKRYRKLGTRGNGAGG